MTTKAVLCFIVQENRVLLAKKKRGFGVGWWNGAGGKVKGEEGETLLEAVLRETKEEIDIVPHDPVQLGTLYFFFEDGTSDWEVAVFHAHSFDGEPTESEEMQPKGSYLKRSPTRRCGRTIPIGFRFYWPARSLKGSLPLKTTIPS